MTKSYDQPDDFADLTDLLMVATECGDACLAHAPECDGFCHHLEGHRNACLEDAEDTDMESVGQVLTRLATAADDAETMVLQNIMVKAGYLWRCPDCKAAFELHISTCEFCGYLHHADAPADDDEDLPAAWSRGTGT